MNALDLFRAGQDTIEIADILGLVEHDAYNSYARARERNYQINAIALDRRKRRERARIRRLEERIAKRRRGLSDDGKILYAGAE